MKLTTLATAFFTTTVLAVTANAAVITLNEAGLDAIYGREGLSIDIRYNASQTVYNAALLSLDDDNEFNTLSTYEVGGNTISMFFVDSINFCGIALANIVGCASRPGTLIALDSGFVANNNAAVTAMGHEVGHNLGLEHVEPNDGTNLMNPTTFAFTTSPLPGLTAGQMESILASGLVQTEAGTGQKYISITPFLVTAAPEPSTLSLFGLALGVAGWKMRRARKA